MLDWAMLSHHHTLYIQVQNVECDDATLWHVLDRSQFKMPSNLFVYISLLLRDIRFLMKCSFEDVFVVKQTFLLLLLRKWYLICMHGSWLMTFVVDRYGGIFWMWKSTLTLCLRTLWWLKLKRLAILKREIARKNQDALSKRKKSHKRMSAPFY